MPLTKAGGAFVHMPLNTFIMQKETTVKKPQETKVEPEFEGNDKAPGEEHGKNELVTKEDLTGKQQIDEDPTEEEQR